MLLDSYVLKKGFEEIFNINHPGTPAPAGYIKRVSQSMAKIDPLLKTLQVRPSPPEALVQAYLIHIGDKSDVNFRKVLDLKGIRKQDQPSLVELFHAHRDSPRNEHLPLSSPLLASLQIQGGGSSSHGGTVLGSISIGNAAGIPSTSSLPARFDPSTFGSALMSAARDGVDRFGTPILGGGASSNTPSGAMSPPQGNEGHAAAAAHLNDNLRNIGKFFKRDLGTFGGRFGGGKSADEGR